MRRDSWSLVMILACLTTFWGCDQIPWVEKENDNNKAKGNEVDGDDSELIMDPWSELALDEYCDLFARLKSYESINHDDAVIKRVTCKYEKGKIVEKREVRSLGTLREDFYAETTYDANEHPLVRKEWATSAKVFLKKHAEYEIDANGLVLKVTNVKPTKATTTNEYDDKLRKVKSIIAVEDATFTTNCTYGSSLKGTVALLGDFSCHAGSANGFSTYGRSANRYTTKKVKAGKTIYEEESEFLDGYVHLLVADKTSEIYSDKEHLKLIDCSLENNELTCTTKRSYDGTEYNSEDSVIEGSTSERDYPGLSVKEFVAKKETISFTYRNDALELKCETKRTYGDFNAPKISDSPITESLTCEKTIGQNHPKLRYASVGYHTRMSPPSDLQDMETSGYTLVMKTQHSYDDKNRLILSEVTEISGPDSATFRASDEKKAVFSY